MLLTLLRCPMEDNQISTNSTLWWWEASYPIITWLPIYLQVKICSIQMSTWILLIWMLLKWRGTVSKLRLMKRGSKITALLNHPKSSTNFKTSMFNFISQHSSILVHRFLTSRILYWNTNSFCMPSSSIRWSFKIRGTINKCKLEGCRPSKIWWVWIHSFLTRCSLSKHLIFQVHPLSWTLRLNSWLNSSFFTSNNSSSSSILWTNNNLCFNSSSSCLSSSHH